MTDSEDKIKRCPGGCGCYVEINADGSNVYPGVIFVGGYIDDRIRAGDLPYYMQPGYVEPGMGGLPKLPQGYSREFESAIVIAIRKESAKS